MLGFLGKEICHFLVAAEHYLWRFLLTKAYLFRDLEVVLEDLVDVRADFVPGLFRGEFFLVEDEADHPWSSLLLFEEFLRGCADVALLRVCVVVDPRGFEEVLDVSLREVERDD